MLMAKGREKRGRVQPSKMEQGQHSAGEGGGDKRPVLGELSLVVLAIHQGVDVLISCHISLLLCQALVKEWHISSPRMYLHRCVRVCLYCCTSKERVLAPKKTKALIHIILPVSRRQR